MARLNEMARQFAETMGIIDPTQTPLERHTQFFPLIKEEYQEVAGAAYGYASGLGETKDLAKELADLVYVCYQYANAVGIDLDTVLERVHASNMSKLVDGKPLRNEAGKVLKGPNYQPPYLNDCIR